MSAVVYNPMGRGERAGRQRHQAAWQMDRDAARISARGDTGQSWPTGKPPTGRHVETKAPAPEPLAAKRDAPRMHRANRQRARGNQHGGVR